MKILKCYLFGHKIVLQKQVTPTTKKIACTCCGRVWGMNDDLQTIVPWTEELQLHHDIQELKTLVQSIKNAV